MEAVNENKKTEGNKMKNNENKTIGLTLTPNAMELFRLYVKDSGNWSGNPMVGGNVTLLGVKEDRGLLTHLKRAGLVTTFTSEGLAFISFTESGIALAFAIDPHSAKCCA